MMTDESSASDFSNQETQVRSFVPVAASQKSDLDLASILDRFTEEIRQGKKPSVEEYAERYSEFSDDIRDLFPTLLILEKGGEREALHQYTTAVGSKGVLPPKREELKNYEIHKELGRGGMGIVYEAYDKTLERLVALKVMKIFPGEEEQSIKRFQREARMAAKLHHTNIVPVYDYEVFDNQFFYAMQLIEGVSLEQFLRAKEKEASQTLEVGSEKSRLSKYLKKRRNKTSQKNDLQQEQKRQDISDARASVDRYFQRLRQNEQAPLDVSNANEAPENAEANASSLKTSPTSNFADSDSGSDVSTEPTSRNKLDETPAPEQPEANGENSKKKNKRQKRVKKPIDASLGDGLPSSDKGLLSVQIASSNYYQQVCDVGIQAANALEYAHRHNVLHRDVKPSNLIVDDDGVVWITDFGLAKPIGDASLTREGQIVGTLRYLAPESVVDNDFSPSSDVFSLGLTLYELLTFTPAYDKTGQSLIEQVSKGVIVRPRKINPHIPRDLETIVLKTLETQKDKRYASAGELADDLQRFLDERPIHARRAFLLERAWRLCKRNKIVASLSAALIMSGIATIVALAFMISNEKKLVLERGENFQEAQNAIDNIFQIITSDLDLSYNLVFSPSDADYSMGKLTITDKDVEALEILLKYNKKLLERENAQDPTSLRKSAYKYAQTGLIYQRLGQSKDSKAFERALELYQICLDKERSPEVKEEVTLEKARVIATILINTPLKSFDDDVLDKSKIALEELDSIIGPTKTNAEIQKLAVELQYIRALSQLRLIRRPNPNLGFFDVQQYDVPDNIRQDIQKDFDSVRERLALLNIPEEECQPEDFQIITNVYSYYALWNALQKNVAEARNWLEKSSSLVEVFKSKYPENAKAVFAEITLCYIKLIVDWETIENQRDPQFQVGNSEAEKGYDQAKARLFELLDGVEIDEKHPDKPLLQMGKIVVSYRIAKNEALLNRLQNAEDLLQNAMEAMNDFIRDYPQNTDFQFSDPLYAAIIELQIKENKIEEARTNLDAMELAFASQEKRVQDASQRLDEEQIKSARENFEQRKIRHEQRISRLQSLLDESLPESPSL